MIFGSWKTTMKHNGIKGKAKPANTKLNGIGYVVSDPSETGTGLRLWGMLTLKFCSV